MKGQKTFWAAGCVAAAFLAWASGASAITVDSTGEGGACSLRTAIQAAADHDNNVGCGPIAPSGTITISLAANTYTPTDGQIVVPSGANISIEGNNLNSPLTTVIDGTGGAVDRLFEVASGGNVTFSGVTLTGGRTPDSPTASSLYTGIPVPPGGAIWNKGSVTIDHSVVKGNRTGDGGDGSAPLPEGGGGDAGPGGNGGAIFNNDYASLTITDSKITGNATGNGGNGGNGATGVGGLGHNPDGKSGGLGAYGGNGGAIHNSHFGSLTISNSTISGNGTGRGGHGGAGGMGSGPTPNPNNPGSFFGAGRGGDGGDGGNSGKQYRKDQGTYWDVTLGGGGIYNLGNLSMSNSTISNNVTGAGGNGGSSGPGGQNAPANTFQSSGRAGTGGGGGRGGGLLTGTQQQGNADLTNVTITGNLTGDGGTGGGGAGGTGSTLGGGVGGYGGDGGGIWSYGAHNGGSTLLTHVTITKNYIGAAGLGGGSASSSPSTPGEKGRGAGLTTGGRYNPSGSSTYLRKTLIAQNGFPFNGDDQCFQAAAAGGYIDIVDQGYSLTWNGASCPAAINANPDLGLLADHGGPTETIVPQPGSPAIGAVPLGQCTTPTDQRGFARPGADGTSCDIGAVEVGTGPTITPTTTTLSSSANPASPGRQVTYTATTSPVPVSGTFSFTDNGVSMPGCSAVALLGGGQGKCQVNYPAVGSHSIQATFSGNSTLGSSASGTLSQSVQGVVVQPDVTPPDTAIDSGPAETSLVTTSSATFAFHGTVGDSVRLRCKLDTGQFQVCVSPKTFTGLSDGTHTVSFRAEDAAGNFDPTPATRTFRVQADITPPPPPPPAAGAKIGKVKVGGPKSTAQGKKATFRVLVKNPGIVPLSRVELKVSGKGAKAKKPVGTIAAGGSKVVKVKVKMKKPGKISIKFKLTSANAATKTFKKGIKVRNRS